MEHLNFEYQAGSGSNKKAGILLVNGFPGFFQNQDIKDRCARQGYDVLTYRPPGWKPSSRAFSINDSIQSLSKTIKLLVDYYPKGKFGVISFCWGSFLHFRALEQISFHVPGFFISPLLVLGDYYDFHSENGKTEFRDLIASGKELLVGKARDWQAEWIAFGQTNEYEVIIRNMDLLKRQLFIFGIKDEELPPDYQMKIREMLMPLSITKESPNGTHFFEGNREFVIENVDEFLGKYV